MVILAIETSCDDTGIALIRAIGKKQPRFKILSSIVSSQNEIHKKWGGVFPTLAKREHQRNLPTVLKKAQSKAGNPKVNLIAVTVGPGLEPCLWQGVNFAKDLAKNWNLPIIPVNHIEAHINISIMNDRQLFTQKIFPAVCLIVSGGHTQLILMRGIGKYKILGETQDDAAGECFDKTARILGLGYPGGPAIAAEAMKYKIQDTRYKIQLPRPMIKQKNYDFSFSGLKTAVLYENKKKKRKNKKYIRAMAAEIQQAIIDVLLSKTLRAAKDYKIKSIILGGGVIANQELRKQFKSTCLTLKIKCLTPPKNLCTDNAAMIGVTAYINNERSSVIYTKENLENIKVNANLRIGK